MNAIIYLLRFAAIGVGICGIIIAAFSITPTYKINYIDYSDQSDEKDKVQLYPEKFSPMFPESYTPTDGKADVTRMADQWRGRRRH